MAQLWRAATASEWRARAEAWVPAIRIRVPAVTSADKCFGWMRAHEQYVPRRFVRDVWRRVKEEEEIIPTINRFPDEQQIPRRMHRTIHQKMRRNTRYIVDIRGTYADTGAPAERTVAIDSDVPLTKGEILDKSVGFADRYNIALAGPEFELGIEHAFHASGRGWE